MMGRNYRRPSLVVQGAHLPDGFAHALRILWAATKHDRGSWKRETPSGHVLNATFAEARRRGWSLAALAAPLGITREAVRLRVLKASDAQPLPIPEPPRNPPRARRPAPPRAVIAGDVSEELRALYDVARWVNGATLPDDPARRAGEVLSARLAELKAAGVSWSALDAAVGTRTGTTRRRLARYGYRPAPPTVHLLKVRPVGGATDESDVAA